MIAWPHIERLLGTFTKHDPILERLEISKKFTLNEYAKKLGIDCSKSLTGVFTSAITNKEIEICGVKKGMNGISLNLYRFRE